MNGAEFGWGARWLPEDLWRAERRARELVEAYPFITRDVGAGTVLLLTLVLAAQAREHDCAPDRVPLAATGYVVVDHRRLLAYLEMMSSGVERGIWLDWFRRPRGVMGVDVFDHAHHLATQVVYAAWLVEVGRVRIGDHVLVVPEVGQADARLWRGRVIAADWHPKVACTPQDVTGGRLADEPYGLWVRPKQRARGACEEHVLACRVLLDAAHHDEPERERAMRVHVARGDLRLFEQVAADGVDRPGDLGG